MRLRIVTPTETLADVEVAEISAPGAAGEIGVLPQHVTFLGQLDAGLVTYVAEGKKVRVVITGGYAEIVDETVTILADDAQFAVDIDSDVARKELERARERRDLPNTSEDEIARLLAEVRLAEIRIASAD